MENNEGNTGVGKHEKAKREQELLDEFEDGYRCCKREMEEQNAALIAALKEKEKHNDQLLMACIAKDELIKELIPIAEERLELAKIMDKHFDDSKIKEQLNKYKSAIERAKLLIN